MSFLTNLLATFSGSSTPTPVAVSALVFAANIIEVKFGYSFSGQHEYSPEQTYASFVKEQAEVAGVTVQANYTPQYIVAGEVFVVDPTLTFTVLNAKYGVTPTTQVVVSVPDFEQPAGRLG